MTLADHRVQAGLWDELVGPDGRPRPAAAPLMELIDALGVTELQARLVDADLDILAMGVTFTVYSDGRGIDRAWPFDVIPRVIDATEWRRIEAGLVQRLAALNQFIDDVYNDQHVVTDGVFPAELLAGASNFRPECRGVRPKLGVWAHVSGSDLVRDAAGTVYVLEDNLRVPSGVSYLLENRLVSKRAFADLFAHQSIQPVDDYPYQLLRLLTSLARDGVTYPTVAVLTPGIYNSAYFEHSFLARRMGCDLVEGRDLVVENDRVYAKTTQGLQRVDVIYRRLDDAFLDPRVFRKDSMLGVPGLVGAYAKGHVTIANAIGNGVCDDKAVYPFVPDIIRYYLGEEPLLDQVETFVCARKKERDYVLENIHKLVVKAVNEAGGYGMLVGPRSTKAEQREFRKRVTAKPRNYIAQPLVELSTCPTWTPRGVTPRRVDLRPYIITGKSSWVLPGGLTRVALKRGSYVVNSSQGGGSKDTWVLEEAKR
jgi:uncharacterized circularly permuted ATP-grasp superfamily protein